MKDLEEKIAQQEAEYERLRAEDKKRALEEIEENRREYEDVEMDSKEARRRFYKSSSRHTPEYRLEMSRKAAEYEDADEKDKNPFRDDEEKKKRPPRRLFDDGGRAMNVNEANLDFDYDDSDSEVIKVTLHIFKHLELSSLDLDVEPTFLRAKVKGKVFQMRFLEEVNSDSAEAARSQATGHVVVTVPKSRPSKAFKPVIEEEKAKKVIKEPSKVVDIRNIVKYEDVPPPLESVLDFEEAENEDEED